MKTEFLGTSALYDDMQYALSYNTTIGLAVHAGFSVFVPITLYSIINQIN